MPIYVTFTKQPRNLSCNICNIRKGHLKGSCCWIFIFSDWFVWLTDLVYSRHLTIYSLFCVSSQHKISRNSIHILDCWIWGKAQSYRYTVLSVFSTPTPKLPSFWPTTTTTVLCLLIVIKAKALDLNALGDVQGIPLLWVDIEEKPWRKPGEQ